jgi:hypothetical protein
MKRFLATSILAACSMLLAIAGYGQTVISSVPFTINTAGVYVLGNALVYSGATGNAITVNTHNVTIDLNGHYLTCTAGSSNTATGIFANNKADIRVRNGEIVGFNRGIGFDYPGSGTNFNFGHAIDVVGFYNNQYGVWLHQSLGSIVRNCIFIGGTAGVDFFNGTGNRAVSNVANGVAFAFFSDGTDYFDSNYADHCTSGVEATSATTRLRFNTTTNCTTGIAGGTSEFSNDQ